MNDAREALPPLVKWAQHNPPLPLSDGTAPALGYQNIYVESKVLAYGTACAKAARRAALEDALEAVDNIEEKRWYGYENPNTFQDGKCEALYAISTLIEKEPK